MQLILLKLSAGVTVDTAPMAVLDVLDDVQVELAFQLIAAECGVPFELLQVEHEGSGIEITEQTLSLNLVQLGVLDGSTLIVRQREAPIKRQRQDVSIYTMPADATPELIIQLCSTHPNLLAQYKSYRPDLHAHIAAGDVGNLRMALMKMRMLQLKEQYDEKQDNIKIAANPDDPEVKSRIAERVRLEAVNDAYSTAQEYFPEAFGNIYMLYVPLEINNFPIKAFVDSGAQMTIMSLQCAERCGIARLIDTRFSGLAKGVGTGKILGKIHLAQMKFGDSYFPVSITILESDSMECLFGLDMLKRHRCQIDLDKGCLRMEGANGKEEVPFLSEADLPSDARQKAEGDDSGESPPAPAAEEEGNKKEGP